jgi:hypothetical protein
MVLPSHLQPMLKHSASDSIYGDQNSPCFSLNWTPQAFQTQSNPPFQKQAFMSANLSSCFDYPHVISTKEVDLAESSPTHDSPTASDSSITAQSSNTSWTSCSDHTGHHVKVQTYAAQSHTTEEIQGPPAPGYWPRAESNVSLFVPPSYSILDADTSMDDAAQYNCVYGFDSSTLTPVSLTGDRMSYIGALSNEIKSERSP